MLYQGGKCGSAVRFLKEGCGLGGEALRMWRQADANRNGKADEVWKLLEEQLFRRWELLGVCYSKIGERKVSWRLYLRTCVALSEFYWCSLHMKLSWRLSRLSLSPSRAKVGLISTHRQA
jgi:hypothetical protein